MEGLPENNNGWYTFTLPDSYELRFVDHTQKRNWEQEYKKGFRSDLALLASIYMLQLKEWNISIDNPEDDIYLREMEEALVLLSVLNTELGDRKDRVLDPEKEELYVDVVASFKLPPKLKKSRPGSGKLEVLEQTLIQNYKTEALCKGLAEMQANRQLSALGLVREEGLCSAPDMESIYRSLMYLYSNSENNSGSDILQDLHKLVTICAGISAINKIESWYKKKRRR